MREVLASCEQLRHETDGAFDIAAGARRRRSRVRARTARPFRLREGLGARTRRRPARGRGRGALLDQRRRRRRRARADRCGPAVADRDSAPLAARQGRRGRFGCERCRGNFGPDRARRPRDRSADVGGRPGGWCRRRSSGPDLGDRRRARHRGGRPRVDRRRMARGRPGRRRPGHHRRRARSSRHRASSSTAHGDRRERTARFWVRFTGDPHAKPRSLRDFGGVLPAVRKLSVPIIAVIAALALAACGGGSSKVSTSGSAATSTTTTPAGRTGLPELGLHHLPEAARRHAPAAGFGGGRRRGGSRRGRRCARCRGGSGGRGGGFFGGGGAGLSSGAAPGRVQRVPLEAADRWLGSVAGGSPAARAPTQLKAYMSCLSDHGVKVPTATSTPRAVPASRRFGNPIAGLRNDPQLRRGEQEVRSVAARPRDAGSATRRCPAG